jgi:hypothetical protein
MPARRSNFWQVILDKFNGGTWTLLDEARIGLNQARETINLLQVQDGLWKVRWGSAYYGLDIPGESTIIGAKEYIKSDGTRELVAIGGTTGKVYKSVDGGTWSEVTGATFTVTKKLFFLQINSYLYITNGYDPLTRYNGSTLTRYTELAAPTGVSLSRGAGLSAGSYTYYYQITALNDIGETVGSTEQSIAVNKERDTWTATSNEYVDISWTAVPGATKYQIYISNASGQEVLLDVSTTNSYRDNNSATENPYVFIPDDNTTGAPKFSQMRMSGNRIWATRDPDYPYRVYWSGVGQYVGYFSAFYGGGWVDLEKGGRERPQWVGHYRTGKGDSAATVLCSTPEGIGAIWQITIETLTVGSDVIPIPVPVKIVGTIGTDAPYAVVEAGDSLVFPNKRGVFDLGNKENIVNVLATTEKSSAIRPSYRSLNLAKIDQFCGYWYDAKIFLSMTEGGGENDMIAILDTERRNWNWKWTVGVKQFLEYTDSSGKTHFLAIPTNGGRLIEFSENISGDLGQPFRTSYISGLIPIDRNKKVFAKVKEALIELGRPKGTINFEVLGVERKKGFSSVASKTITDTVSNIDFTEGLFSDAEFSTDEGPAPKTYAQASVKKWLRIKKKLNAIQFHVYSNAAGTDYTILGLQAEGKISPTKISSNWK